MQLTPAGAARGSHCTDAEGWFRELTNRCGCMARRMARIESPYLDIAKG